MAGLFKTPKPAAVKPVAPMLLIAPVVLAVLAGIVFLVYLVVSGAQSYGEKEKARLEEAARYRQYMRECVLQQSANRCDEIYYWTVRR